MDERSESSCCKSVSRESWLAVAEGRATTILVSELGACWVGKYRKVGSCNNMHILCTITWTDASTTAFKPCTTIVVLMPYKGCDCNAKRLNDDAVETGSSWWPLDLNSIA